MGKLSQLKSIARQYHRHPKGAAGGKGGQFAPKNRTMAEMATTTAISAPNNDTFTTGYNHAFSEFGKGRKGAKGTIIEGRDLPDGFPESGFSSPDDANSWLSQRFPRTKFQLDGVKGRRDEHSLDYEGQKLTNRGFDGEISTLMALTFTRLAEDFPDVAEQMNSLRADDTLRSALGQCSSIGGNVSGSQSLPYIGIRINSSRQKGYKDRESSKEVKLQKARTNWVVLSKIDAVEQSLIHEFGHAIDLFMGEMSKTNPTFLDRGLAESLSGYAKKDHYETFAESFSAYYTGVRTNHPAVEEAGRIVEEFKRKQRR